MEIPTHGTLVGFCEDDHGCVLAAIIVDDGRPQEIKLIHPSKVCFGSGEWTEYVPDWVFNHG